MKKLILIIFITVSFVSNGQVLQSAINKNSENIKAYYEFNLFLKNNNRSINKLNKFENAKLNSNRISNTVDSIKYVLKNNYIDAKKSIANITKQIPNGEVSFVYENVKYIGFIADLNKYNVKIYLNDSNNRKFRSLNNVRKYINTNEHKEVLMATNAGMFMPNNNPQGLLIIDTNIIKHIETKRNAYGNFYMQPNGIFYISNKKAFIKTTQDFIIDSTLYKTPISFATQSGPMLVIDNKIHHKFNYKSKNLNIRSGVGVLNDGRLLFLISMQKVNFFDFASVYKDIFACKNALYLDGAISKMYLPKNNPKELGGNFGPIIAITKNKKIQERKINKNKKTDKKSKNE